jgi:hypothetical protein
MELKQIETKVHTSSLWNNVTKDSLLPFYGSNFLDHGENSDERQNDEVRTDFPNVLASAPLQSPSECPNTSHLGSVSMVRSQSLIYSKPKGEGPAECCMVRGESDPGNFCLQGENLLFGRWLSSGY